MSDIVEHHDTTSILHTDAPIDAHDAAHSDTVALPFIGNVTAPGGIYTVVFGFLAVLTLLEVVLAEVFKSTDGVLFIVRSVALFTISLIKVVLVVWFYMHLQSDNRIFRYVILVPLLVVTISVIYLLGVPVAGGGGYR